MSLFRTLIHCLLGLSLLLGAAGDGMARTMEIGALHAAAVTLPAAQTASGGCHEGMPGEDHGMPADVGSCVDDGSCTPQKACDCACQHLLAAVPQLIQVPAFSLPEDRWTASGSITRHGPPPPRLIRPPIHG